MTSIKDDSLQYSLCQCLNTGVFFMPLDQAASAVEYTDCFSAEE